MEHGKMQLDLRWSTKGSLSSETVSDSDSVTHWVATACTDSPYYGRPGTTVTRVDRGARAPGRALACGSHPVVLRGSVHDLKALAACALRPKFKSECDSRLAEESTRRRMIRSDNDRIIGSCPARSLGVRQPEIRDRTGPSADPGR
eukprot:766496-Hanusia_phi.AAC.1